MILSEPAVARRFSALGTRAQPPTIARLMSLAIDHPRLLSLAAGFTDNATLPQAAVAAAVTELCRGDPETLQYGSNAGRPGLRRRLAERLARLEPGLDPEAAGERLFITNGSQQALYLAVQVLCDPGDIVLVDQPSYFVFLELLAGLGVTARGIPVDAAGQVDAAALARLLAELRNQGQLGRVKAVYFVSYFSNPSGRSLTSAEKSSIAEVLTAAGLRVPVLEDAAYREMHYKQPAGVPSVLGLAAWEAFPRLYVSTLTKSLATGLKVGLAYCTDPEWQSRMLHVKGHHDFGTANFNQAVCEHLLATGGFDRHLGVIRSQYEAKMRVLHAALVDAGLRELGWRWSQPAGGLYLWLEAPECVDTGLEGEFCRRCIDAGVLYVPGALCYGEAAPRNRVRLSFGVLGEAALIEAARRFAMVARAYAPR